MKNNGKHLQFYLDCMKTKELPDFGLCFSIGGDLLKLFEPTKEDEAELSREGLSALYWASGVSPRTVDEKVKFCGFTPLRQTVVLFMAAINNEL